MNDTTVPITDGNWQRARTALDRTGDRFIRLLDRTPHPDTAATAHWSVSDTAAHVETLARCCAPLAGGAPPPFTDGGDLLRRTTVDTVDQFNQTLLGQSTERDPAELGRHLRADLDDLLRATGGADPATAIDWLGGSQIPIAGLLAHLLNELQIHGRDIARATHQTWTVPPEEAALFFELFLLGVTHYGYGHLLDGHGPAPAGRIAVEFRSAHTATRVMAMTDGHVTVEQPGGAVDTRLSFQPAALNLMLFGRISRARAALTGKVVIRGGRRPWTLPAFLRIVRLPS